MSLEFADFAHFYDGSSLSEAQRREDFEVHACFLECIVRYFWRRESVPNSLGISFDKDAIDLLDKLDSDIHLQNQFNNAACEDAGRKAAP